MEGKRTQSCSLQSVTCSLVFLPGVLLRNLRWPTEKGGNKKWFMVDDSGVNECWLKSPGKGKAEGNVPIGFSGRVDCLSETRETRKKKENSEAD